MEQIINLHIERLPENVYLATSNDIQGLVAQGKTLAETITTAKDVAEKLLESQEERQQEIADIPIGNSIDCSVVVGC